MLIIEKRHLITECPCFESRNNSVKPANQNMKKDSNTTLMFMCAINTLHTHSTSYGNGMRKVFRTIILEGWVLNSVQWTSCTNPEGKPRTPMSKRDVAVRILTP